MKSDKTTPNVPTLRFAEFTDEWGKYELSHFVTRITRRNKNNESSLPLTISAQYGLVDQISFFNKTVASVDLSGYYLLYNGDFAYNKSYSNDYAWGAVKRLDKYEKGCLSSLYFVFRPNDNVDSDYVNIERQRGIATTLNRFTMLIATEEKCLKALQKQKSYFLNAMFI